MFPHAFAIDHLQTLVRYRPFDATKDLDPAKRGYLADVIETGRIFIPAAHTLNDPWEAAPVLDDFWWRRDRHLAIAKFLASLTPELAEPERFERMLEETRSFDPNEILRRAQQLLLDGLRNMPILSLSDRPDIFLMWSHYGRGHNGYALVFDATKLPCGGAIRVKYSRWHPSIMIARRDRTGIAADVLATKARQWSYEREWRLIASATRLGFAAFEAAGDNGYYGTLPAGALVGVIIGDRLFRGPHGNDVLALVRKHSPRLESWLAEIDRRAFRIVLRPLRFE